MFNSSEHSPHLKLKRKIELQKIYKERKSHNKHLQTVLWNSNRQRFFMYNVHYFYVHNYVHTILFLHVLFFLCT